MRQRFCLAVILSFMCSVKCSNACKTMCWFGRLQLASNKFSFPYFRTTLPMDYCPFHFYLFTFGLLLWRQIFSFFKYNAHYFNFQQLYSLLLTVRLQHYCPVRGGPDRSHQQEQSHLYCTNYTIMHSFNKHIMVDNVRLIL